MHHVLSMHHVRCSLRQGSLLLTSLVFQFKKTSAAFACQRKQPRRRSRQCRVPPALIASPLSCITSGAKAVECRL